MSSKRHSTIGLCLLLFGVQNANLRVTFCTSFLPNFGNCLCLTDQLVQLGIDFCLVVATVKSWWGGLGQLMVSTHSSKWPNYSLSLNSTLKTRRKFLKIPGRPPHRVKTFLSSPHPKTSPSKVLLGHSIHPSFTFKKAQRAAAENVWVQKDFLGPGHLNRQSGRLAMLVVIAGLQYVVF